MTITSRMSEGRSSHWARTSRVSRPRTRRHRQAPNPRCAFRRRWPPCPPPPAMSRLADQEGHRSRPARKMAKSPSAKPTMTMARPEEFKAARSNAAIAAAPVYATAI
ncbi:hypothetical protein ACU686_09295 [Yinghuangia aomiensis]